MYVYVDGQWQLFQETKYRLFNFLSSGNESRGEETKLDNSQCIY